MSKVLHPHHRPSFYLLFFILFSFVIMLFFMGYIGLAFRRLGFSPLEAFTLLFLTLTGSMVNIPLFKIRSEEPIVVLKEVKWYGIYFRIPVYEVQERTTVVAVNFGGAIVPTYAALLIMARNAPQLPLFLVGIILVSLAVNLFARPVKGLGIVTPLFIPPLFAALVAILLNPFNPAPIAYVSGVLGALIGADLLNLPKVGKLGSPMVSIGGAGTFDGIFLTGIMAVFLAW